MMADDQQQPGQQPKIGPGTGTLPSLVPGLPGTESSTLQLKIKNSICKSVQSKVDGILQDVEKFTDIEKLYLYLKLPSGPNSGNEKSEQTSMSSSRTQQTHAFNWICNHLEEHPETSLPKQEVYDEYKSYCDNLGYHPLSAADFGKIMKNVFPNMKARRLGMRGKSKYCYSGLRKRAFVHMPSLPSLDVHKTGDGCEVMDPLGHLSCVEDEVRSAACGLVCEWAQKVLSRQFDTVEDLARFLVNSHYIGTKSAAALTVLTGSPTGSKMPTQSSAFVPTAESHSFQPQVKTLPSPSDAKQQLQRKIQRRQQEQKLQSPLPGDVHGRRADGGTPGAGTGIPCGSPALLSPQPTIGIVVAAVPSPITVQRGRQPMTSPSPVPMGAAEGKVLPVNFQVVTQSVQPVKQCPKTPQNVPASPVGDRAARGHRYAQILPKPSATSALTLRSPPALLITNSSIKTVMPTSQVSSVNVVKMTTISLGVGNNGSSTTTTTTTTSSAMRPASAGLSGAGQGDEPTPVPRVRSGSLAALRCPVARSGQITMTLNKMDTEAIADGGRAAGDAGRPTVSQEATGGEPRPGAGVPKPRAASVPTLLAKGSAGLCAMTGTKCNGRTLLHGTTVAAGSNNNTNTNESTLYPNVSIQSTSNTPLTSGLTAVASEGGLLSKIPRKRLGLCPESSPTPVKKAFISQMPAGGPEGPKPVNSAGGKREDRSGTPVRPESAPAAAAGKVTVKLNCTVPTRILAHSESPAGNTGFQTVVRPRSISQGRWEESVSDAECRAVVTRTVSAPPNQALLQQHMVKTSNLVPAGSNQINLCAAGEMKSALWRGGLPEGTQQQQQAYAQQGAAEHKQIPMSVVEHHPAMSQPSAANQLAQMHAHMVEYTASQPNAGYFPFNDDDMTQDSIVEELVQMEEQMKMNRSVQSFGSCVDITLQGQQTPVQNAVMSTHQSGTPYYSSAHSSSTPIHTPTPTPTPTPTSEMMGGRDPTRESPCSRLAPATPVDSALGSSRQTPIGTPHSSCSSGVPPSPVECRNPFAFTPINSSITGYHDGSIVSSSPVKPMQRPTATHPDKAKLDWMNNGYNSSSGSSSNGISILPSYQDLVDDHFRKPHAFAIPGQSYQSQTRHHDTHISRLTPISPVQQQVGGMANLTKQEGFAVPAPLDNKTSTSSPGSGTFRCRSVSPAERQRNLSGSHHPNIPHTVVSPFNSPVTPEVLNIFANSHTDASASSMAQRSQSVPLNVMMQTEVLPMQAGQPNGKNITNVLLSKLDGDGDTSLRGLGINNMPSNYTARMNLTQILETSAPSFPGSAGHQALISPSPLGYEFQKPGYHVKNRGETSFSVEESQERSGSVQQMTPQQLIGQHLGQQAVHQQLAEQQLKQQQLVQQPQNQVLLLQQHDLQQHQHHQPMDFNSTVKDLLSQDGVSSGPQPMGQVSELNAMGADLQSDMRLTSELSNSINDLNSLDANLLFDPAQQQGQYEDSTLEELNNDPLFQQICSETVNSAGFDWLESKDQTTVEMLGS